MRDGCFFHPSSRVIFLAAPGAFTDNFAENASLGFAALIVDCMKDSVQNEVMRRGFADCEVNVALEREVRINVVVPVVIATPIAVEIKVSDVITARFIAQRLIKDW